MRLPSLLAGVLIAALLAGCGTDRAVPDVPEATAPDPAELDAYRLTAHSSQGETEAIRTSTCGSASSRLVELPCGVSLGFARVNAPRLFVWRGRDRIFLELGSPASAVFTSLAQGEGDRGLTRRSAWQQLPGTGKRFWVGYGATVEDLPTTTTPTYLSVLVVYEGDMPVPTPAVAGVPDDAVVRNASAEFLVQLATRNKADQP
ncbi:MAG: hypothetical protein PGN13_10845 [Patulibacter minatonensis]